MLHYNVNFLLSELLTEKRVNICASPHEVSNCLSFFQVLKYTQFLVLGIPSLTNISSLSRSQTSKKAKKKRKRKRWLGKLLR
jgi:hypothetical protein